MNSRSREELEHNTAFISLIPNTVFFRIFQSHGGLTRTDSSSICVSTPPIVDLSFKQSQGGDRCVDILVEQTRLNLSVGFLASLARFTFDAMPGDRYADGGFVNQGYVGDLSVHVRALNLTEYVKGGIRLLLCSTFCRQAERSERGATYLT